MPFYSPSPFRFCGRSRVEAVQLGIESDGPQISGVQLVGDPDQAPESYLDSFPELLLNSRLY